MRHRRAEARKLDMGACFSWLLLLAGAVFVLVSMLRWFEQVTDAVDQGWWNKLTLLIVFPFAAWFFPSRVAAGRPTAVPRHQPVRGFGSAPIAPPTSPPDAPPTVASSPAFAPPTAPSSEGPPPGTPPEFIGLPKIPPKRAGAKPAIDADKIAKLRQKMKEQGMLEDEE